MSKGALVIQERQVTMGLHTVMIPYYNLLIFPPILVTFLPFFLHIYKDIVMSLLFSKQRHYNLIDLGQIQAPSYTCYMTLNKLLSTLPPPLSTRRTYCWKQPKCPPVNECIKKLWYINIVEYYTAEIKKEILPFRTAWMGLESIILSEISQAVKEKYHMISPISGT